jgi:hypothetical protein
MKSWYFGWSYQRKTTDVPHLWDVFEAALRPAPLESTEFADGFDAALEVRNTLLNLTMGLFWIRPQAKYSRLCCSQVWHTDMSETSATE